jgi:hypothetical protein
MTLKFRIQTISVRMATPYCASSTILTYCIWHCSPEVAVTQFQSSSRTLSTLSMQVTSLPFNFLAETTATGSGRTPLDKPQWLEEGVFVFMLQSITDPGWFISRCLFRLKPIKGLYVGLWNQRQSPVELLSLFAPLSA